MDFSTLHNVQRVTVIASSQIEHPELHAVARKVGITLAKQNLTLVYEGEPTGLIESVVSGAFDFAGKDISWIQKDGKNIKDSDPGDIAIVLPGGNNIHQKLYNWLGLNLLKLQSKPIGLLNYEGYFDEFLDLHETAKKEGSLPENYFDLFSSDSEIGALLCKLDNMCVRKVAKPQFTLV